VGALELQLLWLTHLAGRGKSSFVAVGAVS